MQLDIHLTITDKRATNIPRTGKVYVEANLAFNDTDLTEERLRALVECIGDETLKTYIIAATCEEPEAAATTLH